MDKSLIEDGEFESRTHERGYNIERTNEMNIDRTVPTWCPVCSWYHISAQDVTDCLDRRREYHARTGVVLPLNFDEPVYDEQDEAIPFDGSSGEATEAPLDGPANYGIQLPF